MLSLTNQTLIFTLYTLGLPITLKKFLTIDDYKRFEENPVLITITFDGDVSYPTLKLYKNMELLDTYIGSADTFLDDSGLFLNNRNPILTDTENYVSDIVLLKGEITSPDFYYLNTLMKTNY